MLALNEKFLVDGKGKRVGVLLDMQDYYQVLDLIEELESIRAYDAAIAEDEELIPFEQAIAEIEEQRD